MKEVVRYTLGLWLSFIVFFAYGQPAKKNDSILLIRNYQKALNSLEHEAITEAIKTCSLSLELANKSQSDCFKPKFYDLLSRAYTKKKDYPTALAYQMRLLDIAERNNDSLQISNAHQSNGDLFTLAEIFDKATDEYIAAIEISPSNAPKTGYVNKLEKAALSNLRTQFYPEAISIYWELHRIYKKQGNKTSQAKALTMIARTYQMMPEYDMALQTYLQLYEFIRPMGNTTALSDCINNIAYLYLKLKNPEQALNYYKTIEYFDGSKLGNAEDLSITYRNISICYQHLGNYPLAIEYLQKSLALPSITGKNDEVDVRNLLSAIYLQKRDTYNAEKHVIEAISIGKAKNYLLGLQDSYRIYSEILQSNANFEEALEYHKLYLSVRDSLRLSDIIKLQAQAQIKREIEQTESQIRLLIAGENLSELRLKQLQLETDKKEKELALLQRERELQKAAFERQKQALALAQQQNEANRQQQRIAQLQQQKALQEVRLKQAQMEEQERGRQIQLLENEKKINELTIQQQQQEENRLRLMFVLGGIVLVFILVSFIFSRRANHKLAHQKRETETRNVELAQKSEEVLAQNEEITRQKELIDKKNNDVTNSLIYAKRIQQAAIPSVTLMQETFDDSFIFFTPREIVSGDFYWVGCIKNKIVVAAADCTGHGVPGAFMSMLGISFLNDVVLSQDIDKADEILEQLRFLVKRSLKQESSSKRAKDGMDIALCVVDSDLSKLEFSGANNPMFIIRKGELIHYKGNRNPIGIFVREKPFTSEVIDLQKGDAIYLFSDGYIDQFGGENGQKFMTKRFKEFLLEIHQLPMKIQRAKLRERLADWQGNSHAQIDDVLVMGFRV